MSVKARMLCDHWIVKLLMENNILMLMNSDVDERNYFFITKGKVEVNKSTYIYFSGNMSMSNIHGKVILSCYGQFQPLLISNET